MTRRGLTACGKISKARGMGVGHAMSRPASSFLLSARLSPTSHLGAERPSRCLASGLSPVRAGGGGRTGGGAPPSAGHFHSRPQLLLTPTCGEGLPVQVTDEELRLRPSQVNLTRSPSSSAGELGLKLRFV